MMMMMMYDFLFFSNPFYACEVFAGYTNSNVLKKQKRVSASEAIDSEHGLRIALLWDRSTFPYNLRRYNELDSSFQKPDF